LRERFRIRFSDTGRSEEMQELWDSLLKFYEIHLPEVEDLEDHLDKPMAKHAKTIHRYFHKLFELDLFESEMKLKSIKRRG